MKMFIWMSFVMCLLVLGTSADSDEGYSLNIASLKNNNKYHQLDDYRLLSHYYDTIKKRITLDDGRKVICSVPLGDVEDHTVEFPEVLGNVTGKDAEAIIMHLQDTCTHHRTKEFLWEFCPGKYFRQYDDLQTVQNAQKPMFELFFLGFAEGIDRNKFLKVISNLTGDYSPQKEHADKKIYSPLMTQRYMQTLGHLVRLSDSTHDFYRHRETNSSHEYMYVLTVYVPASELKENKTVINPAGETLEKYIKAGKKDQITKTIDEVTYVLVERLIRSVICPELLLLEDEFPLDIATSQFDIRIYNNAKIEKKKSFDHTQIFRERSGGYHLYKNFLYGPPENLADANFSRSIILFINQTYAEHRLIISVPSEGVLELNQGIRGEQSREILDIVTIDGKSHSLNNQSWYFVYRRIWLFGTVIIGENTRFKNEFQREDIIFLLDSEVGPAYAREIYKVISDTVMIVRAKRTAKPVATVKSSYFAGSYDDHTESIENARKYLAPKAKKTYRDPALSHVNTDIQRSMYVWGGDEEGYLQCHPSQKFVNSESWLITFSLKLLSLDGSLMIHFGQEECRPEGIEVHFYKMEKLIITNYGEKNNFQAIALTATHLRAIMAQDKMWMLFEKGKLRIGMGSEVSEANLITSFESEIYTKLPYFSLNKMFSHSVRVSNIEVKTPQGDALETLKKMDELPKLDGAMTYFERYTGGTLCGATQKDRELQVEYKCSESGEFLAIENITEPATCMYHLTVGTHLLCPEEYKISHKYMDISKQINCVV